MARVAAELAAARFDARAADGVVKFHRYPVRDDLRYVAGAGRGGIGAVTGIREHGPDAILHFLADVEQSRALGCEHPLVAAGGIGIYSESLDVDVDHAWGLRAVADQQDVAGGG